ncbi:MAG TPA: FIST N-terminal domain-containing protein [Syntrophomonadaceae bacterium]|nr:FIST N-terminal domain-containing protein [Syntrophomonadaceae bacterium]
METEQRIWNEKLGWKTTLPGTFIDAPQVALVFGSTRYMQLHHIYHEIRTFYPHAYIIGCSTAGEISGTRVYDDSIVVTAIEFEHTQVKAACVKNSQASDSKQVGQRLAQLFPEEGLTHLLVFAEGLNMNGTELIKGLIGSLPEHVAVTGGLAGDGDRFQETFIMANGLAERDTIAALGLYGNRLKVGYGSRGGWNPFGPERLVTRSKGNVLYEMDGRSALSLYKLYLGDYANGLPATGMQFPLNLRNQESETPVVRAILGVNEAEESLVFAGDIPEGTYVRLMKANIDRLVGGAITAAEISSVGNEQPELALLISCVARKLVLRQRTEEEVEGVQQVLGGKTLLTGFYSYGEICPHKTGAKSEFHNQTMTITTLSEV